MSIRLFWGQDDIWFGLEHCMMTSSVSRHQSKLQADRVSAGFAVVAGDNLRLMEGKMWVVLCGFEISHLRSPNLFKVSLCYPTLIRVQLGFFCLFSCLWRVPLHLTWPKCLLVSSMVKHTSHVGYMYEALASFPGHVGASVWANLIPIPLGSQCMSQPHSQAMWEAVCALQQTTLVIEWWEDSRNNTTPQKCLIVLFLSTLFHDQHLLKRRNLHETCHSLPAYHCS